MTRQQMKWLALAVILLAFGISKLALINWYLKHRTTPATPVELACHNLGAPCALPDGGQLVFVTPPSNGLSRLSCASLAWPTRNPRWNLPWWTWTWGLIAIVSLPMARRGRRG
ncbi:hypothetical protein [Paludibacterium denitrificans]|uniref:hypothetical protein n=1 Tax=Paludibacterium denitrificans TaxID=2675226 RepID=UPI001E358768|nr:hypothetical protein [Paludibacterium denitrificans]